MAVFINAKGTSAATFQITKTGPTIYQGTGAPTGGNNGDLWIRWGGTEQFYQKVAGTWTLITGGGGGSGTVTSVNITQPLAGITATGGPVTTSGSITLALANDLGALEGLASTGYAVRSTTDTWVQRSITNAANGGFTVTNGDGVSGNTTLALNVNNLTAAAANAATGDFFAAYDTSIAATRKFTLAELSAGVNSTLNLSANYQPLDPTLTSLAAYNTTGFLVQTAADTFTGRTLTNATNGGFTITNPSGTAGNPTFALNVNDLSLAAANTATGDLFAAYDASATATKAFTLAELSAGVNTTLNLSGTYQPLDATLTSLAAYNTNGILVQTAADTFTGRTITGTANQITITNGDGVAGAPTISISANAVMPGTTGMVVPVGTTAQETGTTNGMIRYNSDTNKLRVYQNSAWVDVGAGGGGGASITDGAQTSVSTNTVAGTVTVNANDAGTTRRIANFSVAATGAAAAALDVKSKQNTLTLGVSGTGTNIDISLEPKGTGLVYFGQTGDGEVQSTDGFNLNIRGGDRNATAQVGNLNLLGGDAGSATNAAGGNVILKGGVKSGSGVDGYVVFKTTADVDIMKVGGSVTDGKVKISGNIVGAPFALTDGATITPDFSSGNNFSVTLGGNRTLANPTNIVAGQSGVIVVTQDGSGSRTLSFGSFYKFESGTAPTLTTTIGAVDVFSYYVESSTRIAMKIMVDVK